MCDYSCNVWCGCMVVRVFASYTTGEQTSQVTNLYNMIDKVIYLAFRVTLPSRRMIANMVLHRKSGIPPARILLEANCLRQAARLISRGDRSLCAAELVCLQIQTLSSKKKPENYRNAHEFNCHEFSVHINNSLRWKSPNLC